MSTSTDVGTRRHLGELRNTRPHQGVSALLPGAFDRAWSEHWHAEKGIARSPFSTFAATTLKGRMEERKAARAAEATQRLAEAQEALRLDYESRPRVGDWFQVRTTARARRAFQPTAQREVCVATVRQVFGGAAAFTWEVCDFSTPRREMRGSGSSWEACEGQASAALRSLGFYVPELPPLAKPTAAR